MINLFSALATIIVTVILIVLIKVYGNLKTGSIGVEFNLLTYGSLWETINTAIEGKPYWVGFNPQLLNFKPWLLFAIVFLNIIFTAWNFKLVEKIEALKSQKKSATWVKIFSTFLGIVSLFIFITLKIVFN